MKKIYVAGKYTGKTNSEIDDNIWKAEIASIKLIKKGWCVFTPHKMTAHYERYEDDTITYHTWIAIDDEWLKCCDAIFMLNGWETSKGSMRELEIARGMGIPVYFEQDGFPSPTEENAKQELIDDFGEKL